MLLQSGPKTGMSGLSSLPPNRQLSSISPNHSHNFKQGSLRADHPTCGSLARLMDPTAELGTLHVYISSEDKRNGLYLTGHLQIPDSQTERTLGGTRKNMGIVRSSWCLCPMPEILSLLVCGCRSLPPPPHCHSTRVGRYLSSLISTQLCDDEVVLYTSPQLWTDKY